MSSWSQRGVARLPNITAEASTTTDYEKYLDGKQNALFKAHEPHSEMERTIGVVDDAEVSIRIKA